MITIIAAVADKSPYATFAEVGGGIALGAGLAVLALVIIFVLAIAGWMNSGSH